MECFVSNKVQHLDFCFSMANDYFIKGEHISLGWLCVPFPNPELFHELAPFLTSSRRESMKEVEPEHS